MPIDYYMVFSKNLPKNATFALLGRFETALQPYTGWHFPLFFPLNCRHVYGKIVPMSQRTANFNQKMNSSCLKTPTAFLSTSLGDRRQAIILIF